jgi:hypothetical protein
MRCCLHAVSWQGWKAQEAWEGSDLSGTAQENLDRRSGMIAVDRRTAGSTKPSGSDKSYVSIGLMDGDTLHYSREYVLRAIALSPNQYLELEKFEAIVNTDENRNAVLKKQ